MKQIPQSANLFYSDYKKIKNGIMLPYRYDELPEKFSMMSDIYSSWLPYFEMMAFKRDNPSDPGGLSLLDSVRARGGK